jgi:glycosyltransferase involved in cell wall biosynthesis
VASISALVRFRDDAETLPRVLAALRAQQRAPDELIGVDTGSRDGSAALVRDAGGRVVAWPHSYEPAAVLNAGLAACKGDLVLICSSHTVLQDPDTVADLRACFDDPAVVAASLAWDDKPDPGARIDAVALRRAGLRFGSYYSNSAGMLRRSAWERRPFATGWPHAAEDYRWVVEEILGGAVVHRLRRPFGWLRGNKPWREAYRVACLVFSVASRHDLPLHWKGVRGSLRALRRALGGVVRSAGRDARSRRRLSAHSARIAARFTWRLRLRDQPAVSSGSGPHQVTKSELEVQAR